MLIKYIEEDLKYDGSQLSSLWAYRMFNLQGDSIIAFRGGCEVKEHMVDLEDVKAEAFIYSEDMLHFIIEHFEMNLEKAVLRQRMFISIIVDYLRERGIEAIRSGDDIFIADGKLSVSIATLSPVSSLIHTGLNVSTLNTPVKTAGLSEIGIADVAEMARHIITAYAEEMQDIKLACCKVRGVL